MKRYISIILFLAAILSSCEDKSKETGVTDTDSLNQITSQTFSEAFNFMIVSDWGWNGYYFQQIVADQMAKTADSIDPEFIATCGDNFQVNGVASTSDPLWLSNFENVYNKPSLLVDWYPVLGNHDYHGSTQAQIDYSKISRRWQMKDRYYTFAKEINDSVSVRLIFLDTPQLIEEYRSNPEEYPDAIKQDLKKELVWLEDVLSNSNEQWILVFGHHPIYSASTKHGDTKEMKELVNPLLVKYNVQFYFSGHDHDLQHLSEQGGNTDYIVSGTGGNIRPNSSNELSLFSKSEPGFSVVSLKGDSLKINFVGINGNVIYTYGRQAD